MKKMMYRILAAVCCLAMVFSFVGCGGNNTEDETLAAHEVIVTDIGNGRIVVANLDLEDPFATENLIWEWIPTEALGWEEETQERLIGSISGVKYRWSENFQTNVVLFCTSRGTAGVIEYPSGKCLWKTKVTGISPHSIEMLPNGDIAVTTSGSGNWEAGLIHYYQWTDGKYELTCEVPLNGGHGLLWDPDNEVLWAVGFPTLEAFSPEVGSDGKVALFQVEGWGCAIPDGSGHDLMPVYGNKDLLWFTDNVSILQYSKSKGEMLKEFENSKKLKVMPTVKGVTNFTDGTVVFVSYGDVVGGLDHPATMRVFWPKEDGTYELAKVENVNFGFNKVRVFTTDYV